MGVPALIAILMARVLPPDEFAWIAMVMAFLSFFQILVDGGLGQALVQKEKIDEIDISSSFYFTIAVGLIMAAAFFFAAPWIATFYKQPPLEYIGYWLSLNLILKSIGVVPTALLLRRLRFKAILASTSFSVVFSGVIGVSMAYMGFGIWSLVVYTLSASTLYTLAVLFVGHWTPRLEFSLQRVEETIAFSGNLIASSFLGAIEKNIMTLIIGRLFPPALLAFYNFSLMLALLPVTNICSAAERVLFSSLSRVQKDKDALVSLTRKALQMLSLIIFPMMIGLAMTAPILIPILLTEKWESSIPFLQLFCLLGILYPIHVVNLVVLKAQGRADIFFRLAVIRALIEYPILIVCILWGVGAIIWGQVVASVIALFVNSYFTKKMLHYSIWAQFHDIASYAAASIVMAISILCVDLFQISSAHLNLTLKVLIGVLAYTLWCYSLRLTAFLTLRNWALKYAVLALKAAGQNQGKV